MIVGDAVYVLNEPGGAQCLDLKTGKDRWKQERASSSSWGSFVAAGDRLYVTNLEGETLVFAASPDKFELLAKNDIKERTLASIAVSDGELFFRTYKHLWCISEKK